MTALRLAVARVILRAVRPLARRRLLPFGAVVLACLVAAVVDPREVA